MAWSDAARQAALATRENHKNPNAKTLQKAYRTASQKRRTEMDRNIARNTNPHGYALHVYALRTKLRQR